MSGTANLRLIGGYEVLDELGSGAFSVVYKVIRVADRRTFAMKIISKESLSQPGDKERLQREIDTMFRLEHDSIVSLRDFFEDSTSFYLVMDYCPGGHLLDAIIRMRKVKETQAACAFHQIVSAIRFCHDMGVCHRDLKPANILVDTFPSVKVTDFGLCGFITPDSKMKTFCGSPCYAAPECLNQTAYDGRKADVWSLGVILYEMVTGQHPWNIKNTSMMVKQIQRANFTVPDFVTSSCSELIHSMLRVKPNDRPTCKEILSHPWMRMSGGRRRQSLNLVESPLPPLFTSSPKTTAQGAEEQEIVSPFQWPNRAPRRAGALVKSGSECQIFTSTTARARSPRGVHRFNKTPVLQLTNVPQPSPLAL